LLQSKDKQTESAVRRLAHIMRAGGVTRAGLAWPIGAALFFCIVCGSDRM
jgi:hypothetical protein